MSNLLLKTKQVSLLSDSIKILNPDGETQTWKLENNELRQITTNTISLNDPISILIFQITYVDIQKYSINFSMNSGYQAGLIFNYLDENNYSKVLIKIVDSSSSLLVIAELLQGVSNDVFSTTILQDLLSNPVTLTIMKSDNYLECWLNLQKIHSWSKFISGSFVGVFGQLHSTTLFSEITLTYNSQTSPVNIALDDIISPGSNLYNKTNSSQTTQIQKYLSIKSPSSKSSISFSEIFTVPLDSFYSAFLGINQQENYKLDSAMDTNVDTLDIRPKRWYRELKFVLEEIIDWEAVVTRKSAQIVTYESSCTKIENPSLDDFNQFEQQLDELKTNYKQCIAQLNIRRDRKSLLMREIRTNGYEVIEGTTIQSIIKMGYSFHLVGSQLTPRTYNPIVLPEGVDLLVDTVWQQIETELHTALFATNAIMDYAKPIYLSQKTQLDSFSNNIAIKNEMQNIENDILVYISSKETLVATIPETGKEADIWNEDKKILDTIPITAIAFGELDNVDSPAKNNIQYLDPKYNTMSYPFSESNKYVDFQNLIIKPAENVFSGELLIDFGFDRVKKEKSYVVYSVESSEQIIKLNKINLKIKYLLLGEISSEEKFTSASIFAVSFHISGLGDYFFVIESILDHRGTPPRDLRLFTSTGLDEMEQTLGNELKSICDYFINRYSSQLTYTESKITEISNKIAFLQDRHQYLLIQGLKDERKRFVEFWNNPKTNNTGIIEDRIILPDVDPIAEYLINLRTISGERTMKPYFFAPSFDGYVNQNGIKLSDYINADKQILESSVAIFPVLDTAGNISNEILKAVRSPSKSNKSLIDKLPIIKFVETYKLEVRWLGYGLGELSHAVNLFPGESKELVVEKKTKLHLKKSTSLKEDEQIKRNETSSFEEKLEDAFSSNLKDSQAQEAKDSVSQSNTSSVSDVISNSNTTTTNWNADTEVSFFGLFEVGGGGGQNSTSSSSSTLSKNLANSLAQNRSGTRASNQSKDITRKNLENVVKKIASETSRENKVEFSSIGSEEYEEESVNKEIIKLENPNAGKTVNYNFFQVQNLYGTVIELIDVKIIVNSGMEIMKGTEINDIKVFELEEIGKIFPNSNQTDLEVMLATIIVRQVMKHYGDFADGLTSGNGAVTVRDKSMVLKDRLEILKLSDGEVEELVRTSGIPEIIKRLKNGLEYLKGLPLIFENREISSEVLHAINTGNYHLDAQIGLNEATEPYLEERRVIETELQRSIVNHQKAQTMKGVFFPKIPDTVTHLNFTKIDDENV